MKYQKIAIWRAFLPKTKFFSHPPRVYPLLHPHRAHAHAPALCADSHTRRHATSPPARPPPLLSGAAQCRPREPPWPWSLAMPHVQFAHPPAMEPHPPACVPAAPPSGAPPTSHGAWLRPPRQARPRRPASPPLKLLRAPSSDATSMSQSPFVSPPCTYWLLFLRGRTPR
jgi:hypothetical protein